VTEGYDTILTVPGRDGSASLIVQLNLGVPEPDLSDLEALLDPEKLAALTEALDVAEAPEPAVDHVRQALAHLAAGDIRAGWPPLVIGVEGLFWAEALEAGTSATTTASPTRPRVTARRRTPSTSSWRCRSRKACSASCAVRRSAVRRMCSVTVACTTSGSVRSV
jgi:hypothetical protein